MAGAVGQFDSIYNILILVVVITLIARQINFPATIAFIFAGLLSAFVPRISLPTISPEIFFSILLPPILFAETLTTDVDGLIDDSDTILAYALVGTILMASAIGVYTHFIFGMSWIEAFMLGIIVSPTDPVSVIATFKRLGVIKRFQLIVAGESLFNDGAAVVAYIILSIVIEAGSITGMEVLVITLIEIFGGIIIGYLAGYVVHLTMCWTDDLYIKTLLTFITAFGVYRLADQFHASGVIAVVLAGLILNYRCRNFGGVGEHAEEVLEIMWEFVSFIASSFAFIFIGISLELDLLFSFSLQILALTLVNVIFRYGIIDLLARYLERFRGKRIPRNWRFGMTWSGLRGAISIVLALSITGLGLPNEKLLLALTYGIVLSTNLIQGLSMPVVIKRLKLFSSKSVHIEDEMNVD